MITKALTSRDFLRICSRELLNAGTLALSDEERYAQAESARTVRNFWFTASARPPALPISLTTHIPVVGQTPRFSEPVIVTDILSTFDFKPGLAGPSAMQSRYFLEIIRYGSDDASSGVALFGLPGPVGQEMITKHEKNNSQAITIGSTPDLTATDTQPKWLPFVPRLLKPYDFIEARWFPNPPLTDFSDLIQPSIRTDAWPLQLGFRAARIVPTDSPYRYLTMAFQERIKNYIKNEKPETFFMQVSFPFADIPAIGNPPLMVKTPQQGRPLLILGAVTNLEGCQAGLLSEEDYYKFTFLDAQDRVDSLSLFAPTDVPLNLWAPDSDFRNTNIFNMWPVPHLLLPDAQLSIAVNNGQIPISNAGISFQQTAKTRGSQAARITFLCRTV